MAMVVDKTNFTGEPSSSLALHLYIKEAFIKHLLYAYLLCASDCVQCSLPSRAGDTRIIPVRKL